MDADELTLLRASLRDALTSGRGLEGLGAEDLLAEGGPAVAVLFEELGRAVHPTTSLNAVVLQRIGLEKGAVVFPLPGVDLTTPLRAHRIDGVIACGPGDPDVLVVGDDTCGQLAAADVGVTPLAGLDPEAGWRRVTGTATVTPVDGSWTDAMAAARTALAAELLGIARAISAIAVRHVTDREQFGRPIGSFQSVRHRLAEAHVEQSAAEAVLGLAVRDPDDHYLAVAAKASSGQAFETASRHALQVCGAMGLTWEHPLHRAVRRGSVLNVLLGDAAAHRAALGRRLLDGYPLPTYDPLAGAPTS